ncbi:MAG TPA: hypothetical protein VIV63_06625 [Steroidobacteraceae bacterium]
MPGWKVVAWMSPFLAVLFPLLHGWSVGFKPEAMVLLAAAGAALGVIAAPTIEPASFAYPVAWQVFFSVLACIFVAIQQQAGVPGFAFALVGGVVIGLTAKWWTQGL